jgi:hypothetical protein
MDATCNCGRHGGPQLSRRDFFWRAGAGLGGVALASLLAEETRAALTERIDPINPLRPRKPHYTAKADRVIFLFMYGSPSHVDTFDYKPLLQKLDGKPLPDSLHKNPRFASVVAICPNKLLASPWKFRQRSKSGLWVSDLLPATAGCADDLCVVRSLSSESDNHAPAGLGVNTGVIVEGKPSMGSWITYGLGSLNQNLPGFVVLYDVGPFGGPANWGNAFLPAAFGATRFRDEGEPVPDLTPPRELAPTQRITLDLMQALNKRHQAARPGVLELESRIASYELAYRMQAEALDIGNLPQETEATKRLYGLERKESAKFGRMCLLARRLIERGVRVVQLYNGVNDPIKYGWDAHDDLKGNHDFNAKQTDVPIAGLLKDLKQRGLLERTLVVWSGEFGRTPMVDGSSGRNHNNLAFSAWLAGGGVKGGQAIGATDEVGLHAEQQPHTVHDLHATILTALGIVPEELSFEHNGRPERLTGVAGSAKAIPGVLGST